MKFTKFVSYQRDINRRLLSNIQDLDDVFDHHDSLINAHKCDIDILYELNIELHDRVKILSWVVAFLSISFLCFCVSNFF